MQSLRLQNRRRLVPAKLKRARLLAERTNISEVARLIEIDRMAYLRWEDATKPGLTHLDFVSLAKALELFGVAYDDITEPLPDADLSAPQAIPAQASA